MKTRLYDEHRVEIPVHRFHDQPLIRVSIADHNGSDDVDALLDALRSGHLAGAAIDVIEHEPRTGESLDEALLAHLASFKNLIVTPHIGGATFDSMAATELFVARKAVAFLKQGRT